jgi:hypothetical protein
MDTLIACSEGHGRGVLGFSANAAASLLPSLSPLLSRVFVATEGRGRGSRLVALLWGEAKGGRALGGGAGACCADVMAYITTIFLRRGRRAEARDGARL